MGAAGTRARIIAANKYQPQANAFREVRLDDKGRQITFKRVGDIIITSTGKHDVTQEGWH